ncbi:MAG: signal peptidase I, partial [Eubacteriales bacterium]|nr:signal peptidase I [Eubacteriales bacterium]
MLETSQKGKAKGRSLWTTLVVVVCVLLIPLLVVNLTIIIKSIADPQQVPGFLGYKPLIVLSGSMEPTILPGDIVIVKEVPAEDLQKGDIVSYLRENSVITHRIMEISQTDGNRNFYTKGDNNNADDGVPVTDDMLEGKYLFRIPRLGHAAIFMQTPTGMLLFIAVP